ncbi:MAG: hypothetical protein AAFR57_13895, partial [Pseudomonadota bacterium]
AVLQPKGLFPHTPKGPHHPLATPFMDRVRTPFQACHPVGSALAPTGSERLPRWHRLTPLYTPAPASLWEGRTGTGIDG